MTREKLCARAVEDLTAPDALQIADHLAELYWPEAEWFSQSHVAFLAGQLKAMYARWTGGKAA